ncbi:MAG: 4-hydroxy-3-methylbut-2-enyl diphosphate reductase [Candidatus Porifericomitaceae bacterium WSBS_2022_MAG_OTU9]
MNELRVTLAVPRGFCAGVDRAIRIVQLALQQHGAPVYVRHEIVHNQYVVKELRESGAVFVEELTEVPPGSVVVFSAHGVPTRIYKEAEQLGLRVFDATCPLVTKVHSEVARYLERGLDCILIGHRGHPEVEGTLGQPGAEGRIHLVESEQQVALVQVTNPERLAYATQTTLSVDDTISIVAALKKRFPKIMGPSKNDICYATQNRQDSVKKLAAMCDLILVIGSHNSSNSTRLMEIARKEGSKSYLIDNASEVEPQWLHGCRHLGITAGASAPEVLVKELLESLGRYYKLHTSQMPGKEENVTFHLPKEMTRNSVAATDPT